MKTASLVFIPVLAVLVSACGSTPDSDVPVEERSMAAGPGASRPEPTPSASGSEGLASAATNGPEETGQNPAVIALLQDAGSERARGEYDSAVLSLERALRVEPRNPYLWYRLAALRLEQQNWQQAYVMANKSNSLVSDSPELNILNWEIIARAMTELGDEQAAREAELEILRLQKTE